MDPTEMSPPPLPATPIDLSDDELGGPPNTHSALPSPPPPPPFPPQVVCLSSVVDTGSAESSRLFLARRTALEMLRDRGYGVSLADVGMGLSEFRAVFGDRPDLDKIGITSFLLRDPSKKILVIFFGTSPIKLSTVRALALQYGKDNLNSIILVLQSNISAKARESMKLLFPFRVETFHITELLINVSKHVLIPKHQPLSSEEKQNLLKKYNIQESQLPRMLQTDAIARYYGYEKGTIIRITYEGEIMQDHATYRCVM